MSEPDRRDAERDAWLSAALRHAPDAQATPPAALSEAILLQARAASRALGATPATPSPPRERARATRPWSAAWMWLARPPVAAGFAGVMVATLVGVMWWGRPMDDVLPHPPQPPAASTIPDTAPAAAPASPPGATGAAGADSTTARERSTLSDNALTTDRRAVPPATPPTDPRVARPAAPARAPTSLPERSAPAPAAIAAVRPEPAPFAESAVAPEAPVASPPPGVAAAPAPMPAPAAAPRARAAPAPERATAPRPSRDEALAAHDNPATGAEATHLRELRASKSSAAAAPVAPATALAAGRADADANAAEWRASIATQPDRWAWQRGGAIEPMRPALQRWLADADLSPRSTARPRKGATADTGVLRLYRDGALVTTLRVDDAARRQALDDATR